MWARLDDAILDNPKIIAAGPMGLLLHVAAITWCARNLTDGRIPKRRVRTLICLDGIGTPLAAPPACGPEEDRFLPLDVEELAGELARIGLWHDHGAEWELHDYLVYNPPREKVLADRERARVKKARQRMSPHVSPDVSPGESRGNSAHPVPVPVPDPSAKDPSRSGRGSGGKRRADRAAPLPTDFPFTEARRKFAEAGGVPDPGLEFAQFKDHHRATGKLMYDWEAAWKTWCRNAVKYATQRQQRR